MEGLASFITALNQLLEQVEMQEILAGCDKVPCMEIFYDPGRLSKYGGKRAFCLPVCLPASL
jgi:hypothetical protein